MYDNSWGCIFFMLSLYALNRNAINKRTMTMTKEKDIIHERGSYWVCRTKDSYTVFKSGITHSTSDSSYKKTDDGLSVAIARCNYLGNKELHRGQTELCRSYAKNLAMGI